MNFTRILLIVSILGFWQSLEVSARKKSEQDFYSRYSQAVSQEKVGNNLQAVKLYKSAKQIKASDYAILMKLGMLHLNSDAEGDVREQSLQIALDYLNKAHSMRPGDALVNLLLGKAHEELSSPDKAIKYYIKAVNLEPNNILLKENLGRIYFENENYKQAIEIFNKIVLAYPDNLKARSYLGASLQATDNYLAAIEQYNYVLNYASDEYSILKNLGDSWLAVNQLDKAKESYQKAQELDSNVPNLYADLAYISRKENNLDQAIEYYQKALELKKEPLWQRALAHTLWANKKKQEAIKAFLEIEDYAVAGFIQQDMGDMTAAVESYKSAVEKDPKDHKSHFNLAQIYYELGKNDLAKQEYEKLLEQKPNDVEVVFLVASLRQQMGDLDVAVQYYNDLLANYLVEQDDKDLDTKEKELKNTVHYNLGLAYKQQQNLEKAEQNFETLLEDKELTQEFSKKDKNVYKELSFIKIALGKDVEAEKIINGWLREDPTSLEARNLYADFLVHQSKERKAIEQLRLASVLDKTIKTRLKLANLLHAQNNLYEALAEYQTILQEEPNNINALLGAANNFRSLGFKTEAIGMYEKTLEHHPQDVLANYNYGLLLQDSKELEKARQQYQKVIDLNPSFMQTYYVLGLVYWDLNQKEKAKEIWQKFLTTSKNENLKKQIQKIINGTG